MDMQIERWLDPMIVALLAVPAGSAVFARLMQDAIVSRGDATPAVDWVVFGQLIREELGCDHYPATPTARVEQS
jgi:hypothetical protein